MSVQGFNEIKEILKYFKATLKEQLFGLLSHDWGPHHKMKLGNKAP